MLEDILEDIYISEFLEYDNQLGYLLCDIN